MLKAGTEAPDFTLPDQDGQSNSLASLVDDGPLILYFYPADFTPGCTREACDLRDLHARIVASGLRVVGISPQSPESHGRFREEHALPFTLLSDEDKAVIRAYGVDGPLGIGVRRATFLIDARRRIADAVLADLRIGKHQAFVERAIAAKGGRSA
ncbi:MAG TPA: peroxiredoxin [Steroidobacteraceae bacterium]|nr:peroxiredoxin [Steroidobacteraceae bacterium]